MEDLAEFIPTRPPTAARPLLGLTVLVVEDSRFACEALRLLCVRSGARIRRADSLRAANRHLQVYRPSIAVIDMGLPDGSGADLIETLTAEARQVSVVLATSGDAAQEACALTAGADGFLEKPISSLGAFQQAVLSHLPAESQPPGPRLLHDTTICPDPAAFRDDIAHAADLMQPDIDGPIIGYLSQFLSGVGRSADDRTLMEAADALRQKGTGPQKVKVQLAHLSDLIQDRLARLPSL